MDDDVRQCVYIIHHSATLKVALINNIRYNLVMPISLPTATLLFTDIEGSTRLWEQYPDAMPPSLAQHNEIVRRSIETHHGRVFKTMGDSFHAVFDDIDAAVAAALMIQRQLRAAEWAATGPLRVRIAIHRGAVEEREGDYFGSTLNRTARILVAGHGEQVLLSSAVADSLTLPAGVTLLDLGQHRLRDLTGSEHLYQLVAPDLPSNFPPLRSLQAFAHNLPVQLTSFVGRTEALAEAKRLLSTTHLLTLTGAGGAGKTRLSLQVGADLLDTYSDGVWLVELAPLNDAELVPQAVATALGVREEAGHSIQAAISDYIKPRLMLLILDNCEHLITACARLAEELLRSCPNLRILATSREPLNVMGETTWRVPSLSLPGPTNPLEKLASFESVRLFVERVQAVRPDFALSVDNAAAVAEVCQRLDGMPLAIELAAARIRMMPVEQLATRLDDRFRLLTGGARTALPRQQTLRALIEWSYNLLSPDEQAVFHRLAIFAGGATLAAAEAVCAGNDIAASAVLDLVAQLVDKSLALAEEQQGEARYTMLETIRQYAMERLREVGDVIAFRHHAEYYLTLATEGNAGNTGVSDTNLLTRIGVEHDNIRTALRWCLQHGEAELAARLWVMAWPFWYSRGYLVEARLWLNEVLPLTGAIPTPIYARLLYGEGILHLGQGDWQTSENYLEQSLAVWRSLGDVRWMVNTLNSMGRVLGQLGEFDHARTALDESLALARTIDYQYGVAQSLANLGNVEIFAGAYADAYTYHEQSLALRRELGDQSTIAASLNDLGTIASYQGDITKARILFAQSAEIFREFGPRQSLSIAVFNLALMAVEQQDYGSAQGYFEEGLSVNQELDNKGAIVYALRGMANMRQQQGKLSQAAQLMGAAEAITETVAISATKAERKEWEETSTQIRTKMGEAGYTAGVAAGKRLSIIQAIALFKANDDAGSSVDNIVDNI